MDDEVYEFKVLVTYEKYYSEDSTWGTYIALTEDNIPFFSKPEKNQYDEHISDNTKFCNIVGKMQQLSVGCEYKIKAKYEYNKQYGHQYHPIAIYALIPQTKETQIILFQT